jgi:hypothetical protein
MSPYDLVDNNVSELSVASFFKVKCRPSVEIKRREEKRYRGKERSLLSAQ